MAATTRHNESAYLEPFSESTEAEKILQVTRIFEKAEICCLLPGTSALIFYGAGRLRNDWQVCVPTDRLDDAVSLLKSNTEYEAVTHTMVPQPSSLLHTFPRFKCSGIELYFILVPSEDCCLLCEPSNIQRSSSGLPYPKLDVYIQSLLESYNRVDLCDAVDGSNVTEGWGYDHLNLDRPVNIDWLNRKNNLITEPFFKIGFISDLGSEWKATVEGKQKRLGWKNSPDLFATRFRFHGSKDPWLEHRDGV